MGGIDKTEGEWWSCGPDEIGGTPYLPDGNRDALPDELWFEIQLGFEIGATLPRF